jgi:hypothetical protein
MAALVLVVMLVPIPAVSAAEVTGSRITFADVPVGTTSSLPFLELQGNPATDVVVLDAALWVMFRQSDRSPIATYQPDFPMDVWNISFEAYAPRTGNSYYNMDPGRFGLDAMISNGNSRLGVELAVGNATSEGIYLLEGEARTLLRAGIAPAYPEGNTSDGQRPDRYVVAFQKSAGVVTISIINKAIGLAIVLERPFPAGAPRLEFFSNSVVKLGGGASLSVNGGWMVDDLTVRAPDTKYPTLPRLWSTVDINAAVAIDLVDEDGAPIDASVSIAGHDARRSGSSYLANYHRVVDWSVPTPVNVDTGAVRFRDRLLLSTTSSAPGVSIANWWGGWDWVSVFGTDDCSGYNTVATVYQGFDHPLTAYVQSTAGSSSEILATQSELAMHMPHDYLSWKRKNWAEAISAASSAHTQMEAAYTFASRWDDPSYVGRGDTYISLANPGSAATYEMMFAQFLEGTRIEGASSNPWDVVPGNYSLYGSWWLNNAPWWDSANHSWQPARPIDMMDAQRQYSTDNGNAPWSTVMEIAARGGLLRVYNHQQSQPMLPSAQALLRWIADPKVEYAYENWKATDGEAASYVYARHTTSVSVNPDMDFGYDVRRVDPRNAGYWLVPVTVSIDLGGRQVRSVTVVEHTMGGDVAQTLEPLQGARVMDVGYDIRDGKLQVSAFYNASATIIIDSISTDPHITNYPSTSAFTGENYSYLAKSTPSPSGRPLQWSFNNGSCAWLHGQVIDGTSYLISGVAPLGNFTLSLNVNDGFRDDTVNWTLVASPRLHLQITSLPTLVGAVGVYYEYAAVCEGATAWRVEGSAFWLSVDENGRLHGYAPSSEAGKDVHVHLVATTGSLSTSQDFTLHVNASPADNPKVTLPFIGITVIMALLLVLLLSYAFGKD